MTTANLRPVFVAGGGLHPYRRASEASYVALGLVAVREALADAGITWPAVQSAYVGSAHIGMAAGSTMLRYLGPSGIPVTQVENASASGSSAFRQAVIEVGAGISDVVVAVGVDKPDRRPGGPSKAQLPDPAGGPLPPAVHFALVCEEYRQRTGATERQIAQVAVKNHRHGAANPYAQRQKARTIEEVLASPVVAGTLTRLQCAPRGEGAAAVVLMSREALRRHGIAADRAPRVLASAAATGHDLSVEAAVTRSTALDAYRQAGIGPDDLDVVELHDAFSIEELVYLEALGLCEPGRAAPLLAEGRFDVGGRHAVSPSGGLLAMGHPIGPTGVGQVVELVRQLRGEAGPRQQSGARVGLAHMVGVGGACVIHVLCR